MKGSEMKGSENTLLSKKKISEELPIKKLFSVEQLEEKKRKNKKKDESSNFLFNKLTLDFQPDVSIFDIFVWAKFVKDVMQKPCHFSKNK